MLEILIRLSQLGILSLKFGHALAQEKPRLSDGVLLALLQLLFCCRHSLLEFETLMNRDAPRTARI